MPHGEAQRVMAYAALLGIGVVPERVECDVLDGPALRIGKVGEGGPLVFGERDGQLRHGTDDRPRTAASTIADSPPPGR
ncbi:hypothetical protein [Streptomyces sp. NPDC058572]|uniref:hypothetical protein n=1 Tax=Streptomyces sp. NPDC058572 TaxID=3346546 RepID=UPI003669B128